MNDRNDNCPLHAYNLRLTLRFEELIERKDRRNRSGTLSQLYSRFFKFYFLNQIVTRKRLSE